MMKSLIQPGWRTERIEEEADRVRTKFDPKSTQDLEKVAKEEYGVVEVVKTPLVLASKVTRNPKGLFIFYNASFKPYEPLALAHEIGHIAVGHFNEHQQPGFFTREFEADYFSQLLTGTSPTKYYACLTIDSALVAKELVTRPFIRKREMARLRKAGLPIPQ